jgi:hypothetical protein
MKVTRVEKAEFELENGGVFPINPPLRDKTLRLRRTSQIARNCTLKEKVSSTP